MSKRFIMILLSVTLFAQESYKTVIDLTTGDPHVFEQKILKGIVAHKNYFESSLNELDVVVIIHGDAYPYFEKNPKPIVTKTDKKPVNMAPFRQRITALAESYDVTFLMCEAGMKKRHLTTDDILPFVATIPNAGIGLIEKQNEGYAYIPVTD